MSSRSRSRRRVGRAGASRAVLARAAGVVLAAAGGVAVAGPASADSVNGSTGASCGGGGCTVSVTYTGSAAPAGGSGGAVARVPSLCNWTSKGSPQQMLAYMDGLYDTPYYSGQSGLSLFGPRSDFEKAAKDPSRADSTWYVLSCDGVELTDPRAIAFSGATANTMGSDADFARLARLFGPNEDVPPPLVDVEVLRDAAYDSMTIPEPQIERNPEIDGSGATLVNLDTMFWADDYPDTWDITATVGPISATVVAKSDDYVLTSPAGGVSCTQDQFTTPYSGGAAETGGCRFPFTRSSGGGTFPVQASATWNTTWTGTPAPTVPAALAPLTTSTTVQVPVAESQALVDKAAGVR